MLIFLFALLLLISGCRTYSGFKQVVSSNVAAQPFGAGKYFVVESEGGGKTYLRKVDSSSYVYSSDPTHMIHSIPTLKARAALGGSREATVVRFAKIENSRVLGNYRKYVAEIELFVDVKDKTPEQLLEAKKLGFDGEHSYMYVMLTIDDAGIIRWMGRDDVKDERTITSLSDVKNRFIAEGKRMLKNSGRVKLEEPGEYRVLTTAEFNSELLAFKRAQTAEATEKRHQEQQAEILRKKREEAKKAEERRKIAAAQARAAAERAYQNRDREPTEAEMKAAMGRTVAGALFPVSHVQKLGACRKAAPYDYNCRYRYIGVNWGNFWKVGETWYFQIID